MRDMQASLAKLRTDAAEAALIRDLATDSNKRELFARLAAHLTTLATEVERAIAVRLAKPVRQLRDGILVRPIADRARRLTQRTTAACLRARPMARDAPRGPQRQLSQRAAKAHPVLNKTAPNKGTCVGAAQPQRPGLPALGRYLGVGSTES
jgi:hypothetical protein